MKIAIVTGASSGIGKEFVKQISRYSSLDEIWVIARRQQRLEELKLEVDKPIKVLTMDLTLQEEVVRLKEMLENTHPNIRLLVNCAGYGIRKNFAEGSYEEEIGMVEINCKSLTALTYICLPYMHKNSRMIQMASAAGFLSQAGFAVYSASKAYVLNFSRALNKELRNRKIYVTAVCPGPVDTEFFAISDAGAGIPYYKKFFLAKTDQVVKKALKDSKHKKSVSIYGLLIHLLRMISRFL